jgi:hypothetical protein
MLIFFTIIACSGIAALLRFAWITWRFRKEL